MTARARVLTGTVWHQRSAPRDHRFSYRMWWADLDLDRLDETIASHRALSSHRLWPLRFKRSDYMGQSERPLAESVRDLVAERTGERPDGPIRLLGHLRTFGWCFNPIVVYLCHDTAGELRWVVCDVTNTPWKERHQYVMAATDDGLRDHVEPKMLHVSPFMPMDQRYRFNLSDDDSRFRLRIDTIDDGTEPFSAGVELDASPMSDRSLLGAMVTHPLLTARVTLGIHAQALRLWQRGVPVVRHPHRDRTNETVTRP